ncbi:MAG: D-3-phosphoglycerate dehydrogenase / 2-oxoglutarate reductase [Gammaproteobacteria bacterium]|nr:D-3-phosphoglycerate dehydrogenase / 2-oxoglutarate reductase [Gammaproteobacteria bacterium]
MTLTSETCSSKPVRVLVIGAGPAADAAHLPVLAGLRDRGEIVLVQVCDIQCERAAAARRKFGFLQDSGEGIAALDRTDIDAVYIFGSAQLHFEYGMRALRSGKHLFVEKPVAPTYAQARELAEVASTHRLIAAGGLNRRFSKSLAEVRARAGRAGWRFAEAVFHKPEFRNPPAFGARTWLSANGIHGLDALLFMMGGLPEQLMAQAGESAATQPSVFSVLMRWSDGAQAVFLCNNDAGSRREEYVFHAHDETYSVTGAGLTIERKGHPATTLALPMQGDGFAAEHEAFLQAIRTGTEPLHSLAAIAPSVLLAELIENGFSGRVHLPSMELRAAAQPRAPALAEKSILVAQSVELQAALASLLPQYRLVSLEDVRESTAERPDIVAAVLGRGSSALPADILAKLPGLVVVGIVALSLARHEPEALLARGVRLVNGSSAYAQSVAEFALGLAILGRRRAFLSHGVMREGGWGTVPRTRGFKGSLNRVARSVRPVIKNAGLEPFFLRMWKKASLGVRGPGSVRPRDLQGATVGLIGWGENACAFAERLRHAQARVLVYSEHAAEGDIRSSGAVPVSLGEVLGADIVSLHRGLTEMTRHCLGAAELAKLRPGTVLINIARGALIEPDALLARLKRGDIFACLDTYEEEPLSASHPLRSLPNVFLTSHIAGGSPDNYAAAATEVVRKVAAHLAGRVTQSISAERLRTMS